MKIAVQAGLVFGVMTLLTGVLYPVLVTGIGQLIWPKQSLGSLIIQGEQTIGSALIAQNFSAREYFWPRPSASNFNAVPSGASNLGPTSTILQKLISERREKLAQEHGVAPQAVPDSLVTSSGSGLDPHITLKAAQFQLERVSKARGLDTQGRKQLEQLVDQHLEKPRLGLLREPQLNVLLLNLSLDQSFGKMTR